MIQHPALLYVNDNKVAYDSEGIKGGFPVESGHGSFGVCFVFDIHERGVGQVGWDWGDVDTLYGGFAPAVGVGIGQAGIKRRINIIYDIDKQIQRADFGIWIQPSSFPTVLLGKHTHAEKKKKNDKRFFHNKLIIENYKDNL